MYLYMFTLNIETCAYDIYIYIYVCMYIDICMYIYIYPLDSHSFAADMFLHFPSPSPDHAQVKVQWCSKGSAIVTYSTPAEAQQAITSLNRSTIAGEVVKTHGFRCRFSLKPIQ